MRLISALASFIAAVSITTVACAAPPPAEGDPWSGDGGVSAFYRWPAKLPDRPGVLLRREALEPAYRIDAAGSVQERILYSSTDGMDGKSRIYESGAVYLPKGSPPPGGWPVIAWAHGTTGVADVCAPSTHVRSDHEKVYLSTWLNQGYAVVATDYQGLGTPGVHPYLLYRPEGYSVLDAVRAALVTYKGQLANKVVAVGQSQGSAAAMGAAYVAPGYAPDVHVLGTVATGIVGSVVDVGSAPQLPLPKAGDGSASDAGFEALFLLGTARAIYPDLNPRDYVSDAAVPLLQTATTHCGHEVFAQAAEEKLTLKTFYKRGIESLDTAQAKIGGFPDGRFSTPVFVGTGLADWLAPTANQYNVMSAMCTAGSVVESHYYPGMTHLGAVNGSLPDSLPFVKALFAGQSVTGNCSQLQPPGPLQAANPNVPFNG